MFTGIIEEIGNVESIDNCSVSICCNKILEDMHIGDSIAVDGVCLTVVDFDEHKFVANVSQETYNVTRLKDLCKNDKVNLERAMSATSRFGGHVVTGHVDCVSQIKTLSQKGEFYNLEIGISDNKYVVKKGSIAINGISLTICDLDSDSVKVAVIPHTFDNTNLKYLKNGSNVNIEFDILAKYVEKNILMKDNKSNITEDFLRNNGFM